MAKIKCILYLTACGTRTPSINNDLSSYKGIGSDHHAFPFQAAHCSSPTHQTLVTTHRSSAAAVPGAHQSSSTPPVLLLHSAGRLGLLAGGSAAGRAAARLRGAHEDHPLTQRQEGGADQAEYLVSSGRIGQISGYDEGRKAERGRVEPRWRGPPSRRLEDVRAVEQEREEVVPNVSLAPPSSSSSFLDKVHVAFQAHCSYWCSPLKPMTPAAEGEDGGGSRSGELAPRPSPQQAVR